MSGFDVVFGTDEPAPEHVAWCRAQVEMLKIGGVWGIPRSGLIFTRTGEDELTLTARMPWMPEMEGVITREELVEQQQAEYELNRRYFGAAGIDVIDGTDPRRQETSERCRYEDCGNAFPIALDSERVTCPYCRKDMGLDPIETPDERGV